MNTVKNVRIYNPQKFTVGIVTQDKPLGIAIKPGSFAIISEDDVSYIASVSSIFRRGVLRLDEDNNDLLMGIGINVAKEVNYCDEEDIRKKLSGTAKALGEWLDNIHEDYILDKIFDVAKEMNLPASKIKVLSAKMPNRDFLE